MIIRNVGVRHGRRALAGPLSSSSLRTISSSSTRPSTPTTYAEEPTAAPVAPTIYTAHAYLAAKNAARKAEIARIPKQYAEFKAHTNATRSVGSRVTSRYHPDLYLDNPPHDATLEMLMAAQVHMGHHVSQWNPANQRYIYGERAGIHIISLETTATHLRRAARVVEEVAYHGGLILFVGTRRGQMAPVVKAAELAKGYHLFQKWTAGAITNRDVILSAGEIEILDETDKPLEGFHEHIRDRRPVVPDLVVCLNPMENYPLLHECGNAGIPTVGVIDTDADPTWVTYQIPANDDSLRGITLIAGVLGRAGERGQRRRLADAKEGVVAWRTPEVEKYIAEEASTKLRAEREAMQSAGEGREKPLKREDFMSDDEVLAELNGEAPPV